MKSIKNKNKKSKKTVYIGIALVVLASAIIYGTFSIISAQEKEPKITLRENVVFEYGKEFDSSEIQNLVIDQDNSISITSFDINIDTSSVTVKILENSQERLTDKMESLVKVTIDGKEKEYLFQYDVADTQCPVIEGVQNIELEPGAEVKYPESLKATDPVDGNIEVKFEGTVDTSIPGTYDVKVIASDKNGNTTEESLTVTVLEKVEQKPVVESKPTASNKPKPNSSTTAANSKPVQQTKPSEPIESPKTEEKNDFIDDAPTGMLLYKDYGNFESCSAVVYQVLDENFREWSSNLCTSDGKMFYTPYQ